MNDIRSGFMERHRKCFYEVIDIDPLPAKRPCPEKAQEDPAGEAPPSIVPHLDIAGPRAAVVTQLDVAGPSNTPTV